MTLEEKIEFRALKQNYSLLEMRITALETAMNQEYVTPKELAKILNCSLNNIYIKIRQGKINAIPLGRSYRIPMRQFHDPASDLKRRIFENG